MHRRRLNLDQDLRLLSNESVRVICSPQDAKTHVGKIVTKKCFNPREALLLRIALSTEGLSLPRIRFHRTRPWKIPQLCRQWRRTSLLLTFRCTCINPHPRVSLSNKEVARFVRHILVHQKVAFRISTAVIPSPAHQSRKLMLTCEQPRTRFVGCIRTMSPNLVGIIAATCTSTPTSLVRPRMRSVPLTFRTFLRRHP